MAYWDQVFQFKEEIRSRGIINSEDLRELYFQFDTATGNATACEKIKVLIEIINVETIGFKFADDKILKVETPFELAYLLKVHNITDVYTDSALRQIFPARNSNETIKWQKLVKSKAKQSWFINNIQRRIQEWIAGYHRKTYHKDLKNLKQ